MNTFSTEEIEAKVKELWPHSESSVTVINKEIRITVSAEYEAPGLSFRHLKSLSDFFGTDNINDDDRFSHSGCETCDYGSSYGFTLTVRPV